ncbi:MAG: winged helix-turn-helix domain-containing protein [bacterium]|nr:winged helix-turn-helix domain-containing protein [bacterium]
MRPRGARLTRDAFVDHLERTGGLQLDSVNAVDRAHFLTLWSRFGNYDRETVDRWVGPDRVAYEFIGHEACILPHSSLPYSRRHMRDFNPQSQWWRERLGDPAVRKAVLRRIRREGPLESAQFKSAERGPAGGWWGWKEEKMALEWLWRKGALAVHERRHFRRFFDLAERIYPPGPTARQTEWADSWLYRGLSGNGIAPEAHLQNYITSPRLKAPERRQVIERNLRKRRIVRVEVEGLKVPCYALPEMVENLEDLPAPRGTNLICPFDSLLWQRQRAEDLFDFHYRIEIYVPQPKRKFGYYVLPIMHEGRLVGRLDPKMDRSLKELRINAIHLEPDFKRDTRFDKGLGDCCRELALFLGADKIKMPRGWGKLI